MLAELFVLVVDTTLWDDTELDRNSNSSPYELKRKEIAPLSVSYQI